MSLTAAVPAARPAASSVSEWSIDASHTSAGFAVKHMMVSTVRGQFEKVAGTVFIDEADVTRSSFEVLIEAASVQTRDPKRDEHLRSADFFDVASFPTLRFRSRKIARAGAGLEITGELTMRGVTREIVIAAEDFTASHKNPWGMTVRGISGTARLNRKEWGLTWNAALEAGGLLVGEQVQLQLDAELIAK